MAILRANILRHMKSTTPILAWIAIGTMAVGCSSAQKMAKMAESVTVTSNPSPLVAKAGAVNTELQVNYPSGYFPSKAMLTVTPVLVYDGGEVAAKQIVYQGDKVKDNYKEVSSKGQTTKERVHFNYVKGMEDSHLELRAVASANGKTFAMPTKKVVDGVNTTYMLVDDSGFINYKKDNYQEIVKQTEEGQILYKVNSSDVSKNQLSSKSVKDFQEALDEIKKNERKTLKGTEVVAYASPEGGESFNAKLSDKRSQSADKAWEQITKGKDVADPTVKSIGQDWEGFQELVAKSDIQDKDLILRVLNMYSDPAVRENEIRNMSQVYSSLKTKILPELRRARFIANVEYKNYTSDELLKLVDENSDVLDEEALLRAATLVDSKKKIDLYQKAVDKYGSERAQFNLGVANLEAGNIGAAKNAFDKVATKDAELTNALGVVAMHEGEFDKAIELFNDAETPEATANKGIIEIIRGDYASAARDLKDAPGCCYNKTLAYILNGEIDTAEKSAQCKSPRVAYLKAIIAARKGDSEGVKTNLQRASKDKSLAKRAETDIEFARYR